MDPKSSSPSSFLAMANSLISKTHLLGIADIRQRDSGNPFDKYLVHGNPTAEPQKGKQYELVRGIDPFDIKGRIFFRKSFFLACRKASLKVQFLRDISDSTKLEVPFTMPKILLKVLQPVLPLWT